MMIGLLRRIFVWCWPGSLFSASTAYVLLEASSCAAVAAVGTACVACVGGVILRLGRAGNGVVKENIV